MKTKKPKYDEVEVELVMDAYGVERPRALAILREKERSLREKEEALREKERKQEEARQEMRMKMRMKHRIPRENPELNLGDIDDL